MLDCYQEKLSIVEVNSTHYGIPSASTLQSWRALSALQAFLKQVVELGPDLLGGLLFQCPRTLRV